MVLPKGVKPHPSLRTFGVEAHAQPGALGRAFVRLEVLPHKDVLHLILDGQHCATDCGGKSIREEPRARRMELESGSAQEDKAEEPPMNHVVVGEPHHVTGDDGDQGWTQTRGQRSRSWVLCCTHGILGTPSWECHPPLPPQPPCTFLAPPRGVLLPQGDLHVEGVAVVPERDPGRVLQRFGAAAAVAPLVRAGGTWGAHGALGALGGAQGIGVPQHIGAPSPGGTHTEPQNVPAGMLLSPTLGCSPTRSTPRPPRPAPACSWQMPPCSLVSQPAVRQLPSASM